MTAITVEMHEDALVMHTPHGEIRFTGENLEQLRNMLNERAPAPAYIAEMHRQLAGITTLLEGLCNQQMLITQKLSHRGLH